MFKKIWPLAFCVVCFLVISAHGQTDKEFEKNLAHIAINVDVAETLELQWTNCLKHSAKEDRKSCDSIRAEMVLSDLDTLRFVIALIREGLLDQVHKIAVQQRQESVWVEKDEDIFSTVHFKYDVTHGMIAYHRSADPNVSDLPFIDIVADFLVNEKKQSVRIIDSGPRNQVSRYSKSGSVWSEIREKFNPHDVLKIPKEATNRYAYIMRKFVLALKAGKILQPIEQHSEPRASNTTDAFFNKKSCTGAGLRLDICCLSKKMVVKPDCQFH